MLWLYSCKRLVVVVVVVVVSTMYLVLHSAVAISPCRRSAFVTTRSASRRRILPLFESSSTVSYVDDDNNNKNQTTNELLLQSVLPFPLTHPTMTRLYTGADGQSHFETLPLDLHAFQDVEGAHGYATRRQTTRLSFRVSPPNYSLDWHNAPRRQFVIQLAGQVQITVGSGAQYTLRPGQVLLAED